MTAEKRWFAYTSMPLRTTMPTAEEIDALQQVKEQICYHAEDYITSNDGITPDNAPFVGSADNFTMSLDDDSLNMSTLYNYDQYPQTETMHAFEHIQHILYTRVVVVICFLGLIGNVFNLVILIPKGLHFSMGRIEKFANSGLIALAASDLLFCLTIIPHAFIDMEEQLFTQFTFTLLYKTYNNALINIFIMASTWLTVTLAMGRYLATCHPLRAREVIGMTIAKWCIVLVCIFCVLFNIPRFWTYKIQHIKCDDGSSYYFRYDGYLASNSTFDNAYSWVYFVLGILLPLVLLTFSNTFLIRALRNSRATRRLIRAGDTTETSHYITMTLVVIVIMYITLVSPAELINFLRRHVISSDQTEYVYNLAVAIVNTLQAANFSFNFILYCLINVSFRRSFVKLLSCGRYKTKSRKIVRYRPGSWSSSHNYRLPVSGAKATAFTSIRLTEI
ncbi:hypothetical protein CAPTEDRAFT_195476 [Capitella teleta]|uniref:G-protein coupled receptors family 1 profile domain-containing protein n=1 Tax=Capitella teleta TaxID=283909 RepID=R7VFF2_CAPTE|nr:hypothetical protein CAPTEDRAFT_195476 [Capitella teleta]|eukprot:ELU14405.1 hypothetical protein CAPTEDRAFT_195476 [Capitella teleta]